jgi:multidrug efflux pump subunit AcrA (membrane-fusion protein)
MYAKVRLYTNQLSHRLTIPEASVITRNDETFVFVVTSDNGKAVAKKRAVVTGVSVDGVIEVTEGLAAGEKVVSKGQDLLSDGASVIEINGDSK